MNTILTRSLLLLATATWLAASTASPGLADEKQAARRLLADAGFEGGLIVHLGCGDGTLTAALGAEDGRLVCGLDAHPANVAKARQHVQSRGLYGKVSIDRLADRKLPFIDNLANLVVAEDLAASGVTMDEVTRVLAPGGVALLKRGDKWLKSVKPRPGEMDEWTHFLHNPTNNAVSKDTMVGPLRHLQWVGGPRWSRQHDHMSSSSAIVSAAGRNFYIFDEASNLSIQLPSRWFLIARDAFNGVVLWKRAIPRWHTQMWRLKSGPAQLPRRVVAVGDTVYVTLALEAPVEALDAATGRTKKTYAQTKATDEILYGDGVLYLVVDEEPVRQPLGPRQFDYDVHARPRQVMAVESKSGRTLWQQTAPWVAPGTLTVDEKRVMFYDGQAIVCLDRASGESQWRAECVGKRDSVPSYFLPTLVSYKGVVLFSGSDPGRDDYHRENGLTMWALDAETGKELWSAPHPMSGYRSPEDILVIDDLVWTAPIFNSRDTGIFTGRDLKTGEVKVEFPPDVKTHWFHHRCYRAKATEKYLLTSRTGIEFVDPRAKHWECHHWVRGACLYGIMPANGMVYTSPHPCACYLEAKLYGFTALAPTSPSRAVEREVPDEDRLEQGPAYGRIEEPKAEAADDWPTYRRDTERSGFTKTAVPAELKEVWEAELGGKLSAPVVAGGRVYVAAVDRHTVHALDAASGKPVWSLTAGGRVDSPPTVWQGRVLFGCSDGYVYCLRASDGELAWRFRAAPMDRRHVAFNQVESVWPVHGSVLVEDGVVWCAAGRSMYVDGGLRLLRLDAATGKKLGERVFDDRDPESGNNLQVRLRGLNMPVALADILVSDGNFVYMKSQRFDADGKRLEIDTPTGRIEDQQSETAHLFCPTGFLDDAYWHRSYWVYGLRWASGAGGYFKAGRYAPAGRLLVFDKDRIYGYGRKPQYYRWTTPLERQLFACAKQPKIEQLPRPKPKPGARKKFNAGAKPDAWVAMDWSKDIPIHVRALVLAGDTLFAAGPADVFDEEQTLKAFEDPAVQRNLAQQVRILEGSEGMTLLAFSTKDAAQRAAYRLDSLPVFDGMAAAGGRLFMATADGRVLCLAGDGTKRLEVAARE